MGEAEIDGAVEAVDPAALVSYVRDVHGRTAEWFDGWTSPVSTRSPTHRTG
jgi:hypothetical protein